MGQGVGVLESAAGLDQGVPHPHAVVAGVFAVVGAHRVGAAVAESMSLVVEPDHTDGGGVAAAGTGLGGHAVW